MRSCISSAIGLKRSLENRDHGLKAHGDSPSRRPVSRLICRPQTVERGALVSAYPLARHDDSLKMQHADHRRHSAEVVPKIGLAPRQMKGGYGKTRWVPVVPELDRAIEH